MSHDEFPHCPLPFNVLSLLSFRCASLTQCACLFRLLKVPDLIDSVPSARDSCPRARQICVCICVCVCDTRSLCPSRPVASQLQARTMCASDSPQCVLCNSLERDDSLTMCLSLFTLLSLSYWHTFACISLNSPGCFLFAKVKGCELGGPCHEQTDSSLLLFRDVFRVKAVVLFYIFRKYLVSILFGLKSINYFDVENSIGLLLF